jgi:FkbM family methyltransferase
MLLDGLIYFHYGTLNPKRIRLVESDQYIHVDPTDWRARKRLIAASIRGRYPRNQRFWRTIVPAFAPDTVLDIGLNYGECLFSMKYPLQTRLFGFDANPSLEPFIQRSKEEHQNRGQIETLFELIGEDESGTETFFVDTTWSGCSTAGLDPRDYDQTRYQCIRVPKTSIDAVLQARGHRPDRLFFKIDVEGYEEKVFQGMRETLAVARHAIGFIEFDVSLLRCCGTRPETYWDYLQQQFEVHAFDKQDRLHLVTGLPLADLPRVCGRRQIHTDLVLIKSPDRKLADTVLEGWRSVGRKVAA